MTTDIMMVRWTVVFLVYAALVLDNILLTVVGKDEWHTRSLLIYLETIYKRSFVRQIQHFHNYQL